VNLLNEFIALFNIHILGMLHRASPSSSAGQYY